METAELTAFLARHFDAPNDDTRLVYDRAQLTALISQAKTVLAADASLVTLNAPAIVVGDLHGQWADLRRLFHSPPIGVPSTTNNRHFVFLGNYVGYGPRQLETLCMLLACKTAHPRTVVLLRGDHECANRSDGFFAELLERFPTDGAELWEAFNEVFALLPLAALIGGSVLCVHSGISQQLSSLADIVGIARPCTEPAGLALDLLFALPNYAPGVQPAFSADPDDPEYPQLFSRDAVKFVCAQLGVGLIVRSLQVPKDGFQYFGGEKLMVTVCSAPRISTHPEFDNSGAVLRVEESESGTEICYSFVVLDAAAPNTFVIKTGGVIKKQ